MAEENALETPKACSNDVIRNAKKFLAENPRLVELQGLSDSSLRNPDMLLLHFESARATGGGEVEKFFISPGKKTALLLFKEEKVAGRVVKERYFLIEDSIVTATHPSFHLWNFKQTAVHLVDCKIPSGKSEQAVKDALVTLFESDKYNDSAVSVSAVRLDQSKMEAFVVFDNYLDALLVVDKYKGKDINHKNFSLGKLSGLSEPPQESEDTEGLQDDQSVIMKKTDVQMPLDQIRNLIREFCLDVVVEKRARTFKFTSDDPTMINKLVEIIRMRNDANLKKEAQENSGGEAGLGASVIAGNVVPEPTSTHTIQIKKTSVMAGQLDQLKNALRRVNLDASITEHEDAYVLSGQDDSRLKDFVFEWKTQMAKEFPGMAESDSDSTESSDSDSGADDGTTHRENPPQVGAPVSGSGPPGEVEPKKKRKKKKPNVKKLAAAQGAQGAQPPEGQRKKEKKGAKGGEAKKAEPTKMQGSQAQMAGNGGPDSKKSPKVPSIMISKSKVPAGTTVASLQAQARELGLDVKISDKGPTFLVTGENQASVQKFFSAVGSSGKPEVKGASAPQQKQGKKPAESSQATGQGKLSTFRVAKNQMPPFWTLDLLQRLGKSSGLEVIVAEGPDQYYFTGENSEGMRDFLNKIKATK